MVVLDVPQGAGQSRYESCFLLLEGRIKISSTQDDMQIRNLGNSNASPLRYYWCVVGLLKLHQRYFGAQRLVFAVVSSVSSARLFMLNLTIFTWHSV